MITIFTPTHNRLHTLPRLYESLKKQTDMDFEWIVVDDGSLDGTEVYMRERRTRSPFPVKYFYQENAGKHTTINYGVREASGEYFFIVDSDDFLAEDAVEMIKKYTASLPEDFAGVVFKKINIENKENLNRENLHFTEEYIDSTPIDIVYKHNLLGDKGEVFKTDILRKYPFPKIRGEKFVPEAYIWNKIGKSHKLRYIDYGIYFFEYLDDGYTKNFKKDLERNPKGFGLYYKDMLTYNIPFSAKVKFFIRYIQTVLYAMDREEDRRKEIKRRRKERKSDRFF